jgi:hypothetical protein
MMIHFRRETSSVMKAGARKTTNWKKCKRERKREKHAVPVVSKHLCSFV